MTKPDFRTLCEQLMELAEGKRYDGSAVIAKARTALAQQHVSQPYKLAEPEEAMIPDQYKGHQVHVYRAGFHAGYEHGLTRVTAALSQPEPAPTDEELDEFAVFWWGSDTDERTVADVIECCSMTAYARAVLARWSTPANNTRGTH
jgi:hypothetical protein